MSGKAWARSMMHGGWKTREQDKATVVGDRVITIVNGNGSARCGIEKLPRDLTKFQVEEGERSILLTANSEARKKLVQKMLEEEKNGTSFVSDVKKFLETRRKPLGSMKLIAAR